MASPLISVIIPVCNVAPWLSESLDSVIHQTYGRLEIMLIDDGSTDGSRVICDEYGQNDQRIKVVHRGHNGLSAARNAGLDRATGEIIVFLDADDVMVPNAIECVAKLMEEKASTSIIIFGSEDYDTGKALSAPAEGTYDRIAALRSMTTRLGITGAIWTKAFRAHALQDIRFMEGHNYVDIPLFFRVRDRCSSACVISKRLVRYRKRAGSITASNTPGNINDCLEQKRWLYEYCLKYNTDSCLDDVIKTLELGRINSMLCIYSTLYENKDSEAERVKISLRKELLRDIQGLNLRSKLAVALFQISPMLFVMLYRASHAVRRMKCFH